MTGMSADLPRGPMAESFDVLRNHQPTNERVLEREDEVYGPRVAEQRRWEKLEIDQLHDDALCLRPPSHVILR